jgi:hypothetical protein
MSVDLIIMVAGILAGAFACAPALAGEERVEAFGGKLRNAADRLHGPISKRGKALAKFLIVVLVAIVFGTLVALGSSIRDAAGLSGQALKDNAQEVLTWLKVVGYVCVGVVALTIVAPIVGPVLRFVAWLIGVLVRPRPLAVVAFLLTVAVSVCGYVAAQRSVDGVGIGTRPRPSALRTQRQRGAFACGPVAFRLSPCPNGGGITSPARSSGWRSRNVMTSAPISTGERSGTRRAVLAPRMA